MRGDREVTQRAESQHGVVERGDVLAAGLDRSALHRRTRSGRLVPSRPRVLRVAGAPVTWRGELFAAVRWAGRGAVASHRAAAALWQLDGWEPGPIELTVPADRCPRGQRGVRVHRAVLLDPRDCTTIDGIPVTGIALSLVNLATFLDRDRLATALDSALVQGLTRADRVLGRIDANGRRGRRGIGTLVALLGERMDGRRPHASRFERRLSELLTHHGCPVAARQHEIRVAGRVVARPDLAFPDLRIAVEADGSRWHASRSAWEHDLSRRTQLAALGWLVLHFSWRDLVERPEYVVTQVERTLATRDV